MFEKEAFEVIKKVQPSAIGVIQKLLKLGQTPSQIANKYRTRDVSFAALMELAATYMLEREEYQA